MLLYSANPEADREFFRDVLGFPAVDAGGGWLIFALPPGEVAVHPMEAAGPNHAGHELLGAALYLMCDDLAAVVERLAVRQVRCSEVDEAPWGSKTTIRLPSGGELGLYQPRHPTALGLTRGS